MNENEIMEMTEVNEEPEVVEEKTGMGIGMAMLIGSGLTLAAIAAVKQGKKVWHYVKTKTAKKPAEEDNVIDITEDVSEEE